MQQHSTKSLSQQQILSIVQQNQRLHSQVTSTRKQLKKVQQKYQKSLKQLALIVKANETLKKEYDSLQQQINKTVEQKTQANKQRMKEYLKKDLDDLNKTIETLNQDKDKLELQNSTLKLKLNALGQEKSKLIKDKQQIEKKYRILESQLQQLDPETRDNNTRTLAVKQLKEKARLVDELQEMIHQLESEKKSIHQEYQQQLSEIQELWNQWREFQKELNGTANNGEKLSLSGVETGKRQGETHGKRKRRASVIYEEGMKVIKKSGGNKKRQQHSESKRQSHDLKTLRNQLQELSVQNTKLKSLLTTQQQNQQQLYELRKINQKLTEQKLMAEQRLSEFRISNIIQETTHTQKASSLSSGQDDLISILKDLHLQLSPLRQELISLKKQQAEQSQTTSTERATFEVKLIRMEKQLQFHKDHNDLLKKQLSEIKSQMHLVSQLNRRISELEQQKSLLEGKLIVLETLNVTDRTRVDGQTYSVLKEFEKRMELLVQGGSSIFKELEGNHLQHLVAMKAYILELDERLKNLTGENQKLTKKYTYSKEKTNQLSIYIKQLQNQQTDRILMYKQKIQAYDKLVNKLTLELQKNIAKNNLHSAYNQQPNQQFSRATNQAKNVPTSRITPEKQYNQVINLYEEKMMNMGEEILRLKGDREHLEGQIKQLRFQLNSRIRELNDKERDLIRIKTQNITLTNSKNTLERQMIELKALNEFYLKNNSQGQLLEKSRFITLLEEQNQQIKHNYQEENQRMKQVYQTEINQLRQKITQLESELNNRVNFTNVEEESKRQSTQKKQQEGVNKSESEQELSKLKQDEIRQIRQDYENQQIASVELVISQHQQIIQKLNQQHQFLILQKDKSIEKLQYSIKQLEEQIVSLTQLIKNLQKSKQSLQQLSNSKDRQLRQLQEVILKNNQQISQLRNQKKRSQYFQIESQNLTTEQTHEFMDQNARLNSQIFELNVKISGLQSIKYNLKLQNEILRGDCQFMQEKLNSIQKDMKMKNSTIFHLENDVRNYSSSYESTLMAKDSLIRSYENEIKNLKLALDDLKGIMVMEKEHQENKIKELERRLVEGSSYQQMQHSNKQLVNKTLQNVNISANQYNNSSNNQLNTLSNSSDQSQQLMQQQLLTNLQQKINRLQSQLKYTQQKLLHSSQQLSKLQKQQSLPQNTSSSNILPYASQQSNSNISMYWQEEVNELKGQVLNLRRDIVALKTEIQFKEQEIQLHKQEVYRLRLGKFDAVNNNSRREEERIEIKEEQNQQLINTSHQEHKAVMTDRSPRKSPIHIITTEPSPQPQPELTQLLLQNKQLLINQSHLNQTISIQNQSIQNLNSQIHRLNEQISRLNSQIHGLNQQLTSLSQQLSNYKQAQTTINANILLQLQKLRQRQNMTENQKCRLLAQDIQKMESAIFEIKNDYELEINHLRQSIKALENELIGKDLKISELMRVMVETRLAISDQVGNDFSTYHDQHTSLSTQSQQQYPDITYLLQQIQRQSQLLISKQHQLTEANTLITKLQSDKTRSRQNLSLIVLLIVEIQSLRNQLFQLQQKSKASHSQTIEGNKMSRNASRELQQQEDERQKVDFSLIKILQCSHQHLLNYEKMLVDRRVNEQSKRISQNSRKSINSVKLQQSSQHINSEQIIPQPQTLTIIKSSKGIISQHSEQDSLPSHTLIAPKFNQHPQQQKHTHIGSMKSQQVISFPSQSHSSSISNLDSNYNIKNPLRNFYRNAESTYSPMMFLPQSSKLQHEPSQTTRRIEKNSMTLGSFGKISQSHNIESSYGESSGSSYVPNDNDGSNGYSYTLKNVNMIESVGNDDNGRNGHAISMSRPYYSIPTDSPNKLQNEYSFGKPKQFGINSQSSIAAEVQSRYVVEKRSPTTYFSPSESVFSKTYTLNNPLNSSGSTIPLSTEIKPIGSSSNLQMSTGNSKSIYPYTGVYNMNGSSTDRNTIDKSMSSDSKASSNSYLPTYNNSTTGSFLPPTNLYSTNFMSTLGDTSSTYQHYLTKKF